MKLSTQHYLLFILLLTTGIYLNSFQNQFVWDDHDFIVEWETAHDPSQIWNLLTGVQPSIHTSGTYRPVISVYYLASYMIWGAESPFGYHLQSLLFHVLATYLVFLCMREITKNDRLSLITTLLFGIHPVHAEVVNFMTSSYDIAAVFLFASLYFYLRAKKEKKYFLPSLLCATLAFFSYELTVVLPTLLVLYEICFNKKWKQEIINIWPYFVSVGIFLALRTSLLTNTFRGSYLGGSFFHNMLAASKAAFKYLTLGFLPYPLSINHTISEGILAIKKDSFTENVLAQTPFDPQILLSLFVIGGLLYFAYTYYKKQPLLAFSIGWFFLALLPALNLVPNLFLLAERYAYVSMLAPCIAIALGIEWLYKKKKFKQYALPALIAITLLFSIIVIDRNTDWQSDETLWLSVLEHSPQSILARQSLAEYYFKTNQPQQAIAQFEEGLEINENNPNLLNDIGTFHHKQGNLQEAFTYYSQAYKIDNTNVAALQNMGAVALQAGDTARAIDFLEEAIGINPLSAKARLNLGTAYLMQKDVDSAKKHYSFIVDQGLNADDELSRARDMLSQLQ